MPVVTFYLTEEQYLEWVKLKKDKRKDFIEWALKAYVAKKKDDNL